MQRTLLSLLTASMAVLSFASAQDVWNFQPVRISGSGTRTPSVASYAGGRFLLAGGSTAFWTSASGTSDWVETALPSGPGYSSGGMATDGNIVVVAGGGNTVFTTTAASTPTPGLNRAT
ncbi:MAG: hypothetical protein ABJQ29_04080 [Luteolibacter sp.]